MRLTIYGKPGCHLCDVMKDVVRRVAADYPHDIAVDEIDITADADLQDLYGTEIPVLFIDGKKAAKYRLTDDNLRRLLRGRS